jgi:hypothetical protein
MVLLAIEASKPGGSTFRLLFGWHIPRLASWFAGLTGLL